MFTRRHLPHRIPDNAVIFVTWRVAGASPLANPRGAQVVANALIYVEGNPVAAGLKNWPWSSKTVGQAILSPVIE